MINYIIEANLALLLFFATYQLFLKPETNFRFLRFYMLVAILVSVISPLIHLNGDQQTHIPSIGQVLPEYWLPEISIGDPATVSSAATSGKAYNAWQVAGWIYTVGVVVFFMWLIMQLGYVWITMRNATTYKMDRFRIVESPDDKPTFSFFNLIYIGRAQELSAFEKEQIIRHESVHARQLHSLDILLITILGIVFWFNPLIKRYKKIFIQLHEFEADARAVENSDVNKYCSLLARVALQSHFPIASHFNESLTVKRIEMMRTIKRKIRPWKIATVTIALALCIFVIACQDQMIEEMAKSTISQTGDYPAEVKAAMEKYSREHPDAKLTYMEGAPSEIEKFQSTEEIKSRLIGTYDVDKGGIEKKGVLLTDVVEHAGRLKTQDRIFMVVENQPEFPGGYDAMKNFIQQNLKYPEAAKKAGKTGVVYISMVINENGSVSDVDVLRGIDPAMDAEAKRVVSLLSNWIPGSQNGKNVKVRFTLPIRFGEMDLNPTDEVRNTDFEMEIEYSIQRSGNETIIRGTVANKSANGKRLAGANLVLAGTTQGVTTDENGNFTLKFEKSKGQLVASHIGFKTSVIDF